MLLLLVLIILLVPMLPTLLVLFLQLRFQIPERTVSEYLNDCQYYNTASLLLPLPNDAAQILNNLTE